MATERAAKIIDLVVAELVECVPDKVEHVVTLSLSGPARCSCGHIFLVNEMALSLIRCPLDVNG